ncbi:MAG TPA: LL-diaminopimelate aminotransferase [Clostridiales bacterium]|nr:LL-diaminopimelate aminotransferase [Clostridiales bacterium]
MKINHNYLKLKDSYLFARIADKVEESRKNNPRESVISLGIGDVTLPLVPVVIEAMHEAVSEMGNAETFRGYGEYQGYDFLRKAVCDYYARKDISLDISEVFISDGAKSDIGNILDIFDVDNTVIIPDPVYPVYVDTNVMAGRKIVFADGTEQNGFLPLPDEKTEGDVVYICSPNNPTGAVYTKDQLKMWVDWALERQAVILFDSAYEAYVRDPDLPTSIYAIRGARKCAIEFCSLSKTAGFTGVRCGYTVIPNDLKRDNISLNRLWYRRQSTRFNGGPYIVQRGAAAVFTDTGLKQISGQIGYYLENARIIADALTELGIWFTGGRNSPYIWLKCPNGMSSWEFFAFLLENCGVVGTPGEGFGKNGEGFFRLTAFGNRENVMEAMERIRKAL